MPWHKNPTPSSPPRETEDVEIEVVDHSESFGAPFLIISPREGKRYQSLLANEITCPRYIHWELMRALKIEDQFIEYLKVLNLHKFATLKFTAYDHLVLEFLVSFEYDEKFSRVHFRMLGGKYSVTLANMKNFFGFPPSGIKEKPSKFNIAAAWHELTGFNNWNTKGVSSMFIQDPVLSILYKYLAFTLSGKEQANKVNSTEIYLLYCAKKGMKVCMSTFFWAAIQGMIQRDVQHPSFCALISALAVSVGAMEPNSPPPPGQTQITQYNIDKSELKRAQIIRSDLSFFPPSKHACIQRLQLVRETTMRITGEGSSRAHQEEDADEENEEGQYREETGVEDEVPVHPQPYADWNTFRGYYDSSMGQFQQNFQQTFTDSMGGFQQTVMDSIGDLRRDLGELRQDMSSFRQDMSSFQQDFGEYRQDTTNRWESQGERMTALEQSWNTWTLGNPYPPPPPPTPPFHDAQQD